MQIVQRWMGRGARRRKAAKQRRREVAKVFRMPARVGEGGRRVQTWGTRARGKAGRRTPLDSSFKPGPGACTGWHLGRLTLMHKVTGDLLLNAGN